MVDVAGDGVTEIGGASTTAAMWQRDPLVPVIVSVELADGVFDEVVTVRVVLPDPVMADGLNDADAPVGKPLALRLTVPAKPFSAPTLTV
jgi:hypothetical protein